MGGIDNLTGEELGIFVDIDLIDGNIDNFIKIVPPKRNHSMIYIKKKIYIIGGNDEKCILYDIENKKIEEFGKLNRKRFEPSLIKHSNYLFCFDAFRKNTEKYSFERINLKDDTKIWDIIFPKISSLINNTIYNQKFFGIVEDNLFNIIFLGGMYDNYLKENNDENLEKNIYCIKYNILKNSMEYSDILFQDISLMEKTFLPLDDDNLFLLFEEKKKLKKINFSKIKKIMDIEELEISKTKNEKNKNYKTSLIFPKINNSPGGINFDMPGKKLINKEENDKLIEKTNNEKKTIKEVNDKVNNKNDSENNDPENNNIIENDNNNHKITEIKIHEPKTEVNIVNELNNNIEINKENSIKEYNINDEKSNLDKIDINENLKEEVEGKNKKISSNTNYNYTGKNTKENENNINKENKIYNDKAKESFQNFHSCVNLNLDTEPNLEIEKIKKYNFISNRKVIKKEGMEIMRQNFDDIKETNY